MSRYTMISVLLLLVTIHTQQGYVYARRFNMAGQPIETRMMPGLNSLVLEAERLVQDKMHGSTMGEMHAEGMQEMKEEIGELRQMMDTMPYVSEDEMQSEEYSPRLRRVLHKITSVVGVIDDAVVTGSSIVGLTNPDGSARGLGDKLKGWFHKARNLVKRSIGEPGSEQRNDVVMTVRAVTNLSLRIANLFQV